MGTGAKIFNLLSNMCQCEHKEAFLLYSIAFCVSITLNNIKKKVFQIILVESAVNTPVVGK